MVIKYYVYILTTKKNTAVYVGVTNDLRRRVEEHRLGGVSGFTRRYNIHKLVHFEIFGTINEAIRREKRLKNWHREWKNELINEKNPTWQDLTNNIPS